jgi:diaminohydroxyphosphoribosylaminopyrimidine deaminase/5-amino-6-(5-phosphoribosylamino)uracil reductase
MKDPNPAVSGRGFAELRRAGIEVKPGVREQEAQRVNEAFAWWMRTGRPLVTLKSALTLDGQIALRPGRPTAISSVASRKEVQRLRHAADAVLTGIGTVLADDPRLTDRTGLPRRRPLLRVVLDSSLRISARSILVRTARKDVIVFTLQPPDSPKARALEKAGVEVVRVRGRAGRPELRAVLRELGRRQILSVILEAGADLNGAALEAGVVDKMLLFYAPRIMGTRGVPLARTSKQWFAEGPALSNLSCRQFGPDFAVEGYLHDVYGNH